MNNLTDDQKQVLEEIPGYVRIESLRKYCNFFINDLMEKNDMFSMGKSVALCQLMTDLHNGYLTGEVD